MKQNVKRWLLPMVFVLAGALIGLAFYYCAGCADGNCVITANPFRSMLYMGLVGWLLSLGLMKAPKSSY